MSIEQACELVRQTLVMALLVSAPLLIVGLVVGLVISLLQAVTQIQEQTIVFVPKILAMIGAAVVVMPWIASRLVSFAQSVWTGGL
ncbi:MAG: flagellar biosynthesis protein FliQ [Tepidisphaerales bacterium]